MSAADLDTMHRAVLLDPGDDVARLAFADACEEAGQIARAEFVRVQVALSKPCPLGYSDSYHVDGVCRVCDLLDARQRELLMTLPKDPLTAACDKVKYVRGFVESVALPLAAFMRHAGELFARHPITAVTLTDREPNDVSTADRGVLYAWLCWRWSYMEAELIPGGSSTPYDVPQELLSHSPYKWMYFDTPELAHAALSAACVAHGRRLAGLPPLPVHPRYEHAGEMDR